MKKTIIALMAMSGSAFGLNITGSATVTNDSSLTQYTVIDATTTLDFAYNLNNVVTKNHTLTTIGDTVEAASIDGYGLGTSDCTLTLNVQGVLAISGTVKIPTSGTTKLEVTTTISDAEILTLNTKGTASRWVVTAADGFQNINTITKIQAITLNGLSGYEQGAVIFDLNGTYYSLDSVTMADQKATINTGATALTLNDDTVYTTLKISSSSNAAVTGVGFVVKTAPIPEPTTATLSLLALAGLTMRRRRK